MFFLKTERQSCLSPHIKGILDLGPGKGSYTPGILSVNTPLFIYNFTYTSSIYHIRVVFVKL